MSLGSIPSEAFMNRLLLQISFLFPLQFKYEASDVPSCIGCPDVLKRAYRVLY